MKLVELELFSSNDVKSNVFTTPSELENKTSRLFRKTSAVLSIPVETNKALESSIQELRLNQFFTATDHVEKVSGHQESLRERVSEAFERVEAFLETAETVAEWGQLVTSVEQFSESALACIEDVSAPLQLIILASEVSEAASCVLGKNAELAEAPSKIAQLGFSIVARFCNTVAVVQKMGIIAPGIALSLQLSVLGAFCLLLSNAVDLGDNLLHYSTAAKLLAVTINFTASVLSLYLIFQVSASLQLLSLILTSGTLFLSAATGIN